MTQGKALRPGHLLLAIAALQFFATPAHAKRPSEPPESVGRTPETCQDTDGWKFFMGVPYADTLQALPSDVLLAGAEALRNDGWIVEPPGDDPNAIITRWKPIRNFVFRLFVGGSVARCFVSVTSASDGQTIVVFQSGLATRHSVKDSPVEALANRSYRTAVRNWQRDMRLALALDAGEPSEISAKPDSSNSDAWMEIPR